MYYSTKELWRLRLSACWRQQTYPAAVEASWGGGGEEGMSLLDVELGPRSAEDRGLVFSGTARTTLWFQCKYGRSAFRFPSTEPAVWSSPSSFSPVLGMFCVSFALLRLCDSCLPPRRSWHSCVELFIICLFVFFKSEFWEEAGIVVPEFNSPLTPNGKLCCASPCKVDWAPSSLPQTFSLKNLYSWFFSASSATLKLVVVDICSFPRISLTLFK